MEHPALGSFHVVTLSHFHIIAFITTKRPTLAFLRQRDVIELSNVIVYDDNTIQQVRLQDIFIYAMLTCSLLSQLLSLCYEQNPDDEITNPP